MPRAKGGFKSRRRRKKIIKMAKGYVGGRGRLFKTAKETVEKGLTYAYRDRRVKKREFRKLWIVRINAAARDNGTNYSRLMKAMKDADIAIDRKVLADMAVSDPEGFASVVKMAQAG